MANAFNFESAVLWRDGRDYLGQINEVEMPELSWTMTDHETIGLIGTPQYPTKLEAMEITLTPMGYCPGLVEAASDPFTAYNFQLRSNFGEYASSTKVGDRLLKLDFVGKFSMMQPGTFSPSEYESEFTVSCTYLKLSFNGQEIVEIDVNVPTYRSRGRDIISRMRRNLGV